MRQAAAMLFLCASVLATPAVADGPSSLAKSATLRYREVTDMGAGCKIAVTFPGGLSGRVGNGGNPKFGGGGMGITPLPKAWKSSLDRLDFEISCRDKNDPNNPLPSGTYDEVTRTWVKDAGKMLARFKDSKDAATREMAEQIVETTSIYDVKTINAQGWADTYEQLIGDEDSRIKGLNFCVYHDEKALCGIGDVALLRDGQKGDLSTRALKIIRSIEFLD